MRACRLVAGKQRRFKHSSELQRAVAKVAVTLVPALACSAALGDPILPLTPTVTGSTYNIAAQYANGSYVYGGPTGGDWANDINNTAIACNSAGGGTMRWRKRASGFGRSCQATSTITRYRGIWTAWEPFGNG